jgi:predicted acylesterase/phospholipase RssA/proteasome lid subunit RPN8/RPN11
MTDGQRLALEQIKEIVVRDDYVIDIEDVREPSPSEGRLAIEISLHCGDLLHAPGGLALRERERLQIYVPADFPYQKPEVWVRHKRFAGTPHVQWTRHLCLYQAPQTEWSVDDGMFGFIERLHLWLRRAALNQLDQEGGPLHPPVAYTDGTAKTPVVMRADAPAINGSAWLGYAHVRSVGRRVEVVDWTVAPEKLDDLALAPALLLPTWMPWEFPSQLAELFGQIMERGAELRELVFHLQTAALLNDENSPLYAVVGTPMRGIRGGQPRQHLAVWYIEPEQTRDLSVSLLKGFTKNELVKQLADEAYKRVVDWALTATVHWCHVLEARPEITVRRDHESASAYFRNREVLLLGCGALGSHVAFFLAQSGVKRLVLKDYGIVKPGVLVRQLYTDADIGRSKAYALADRLKSLRPDLDVVAAAVDLSTNFKQAGDWTQGCHLIIDCTASAIIQSRLEAVRQAETGASPAMVSMVISRLADRGLVVVAHTTHTGGPADVYFRTKIEVCKRPWLNAYSREFYPENDRTDLFQPEPGCSDPTFVGSGADVAALSGTLLNIAATELARPTGSAAGYLTSQPASVVSEEGETARVSFSWEPDVVCADSHKGFQIRISRGAWLDMQSAIGRARRELGEGVETGGLLYGRRDDVLKTMWVAEASGPPPDSRASADGFVCGIEGGEDGYAQRRQRFRGSIQCIGTWHTHPMCRPLPSVRDVLGVAQILTESSLSPAKTLLVIVGLTDNDSQVGAYVFARTDFLQDEYAATFAPSFTLVNRRPALGSVGLALSGGGSRAIAFHLGCMRALRDRGVLEQLAVVSAVSGGSVIAALYMYLNQPFEVFESTVIELLRKGLQRQIVRELFFSSLAVETLVTTAVAGGAALGARCLGTQPPFRRWKSRTHALERALSRTLGPLRLSDPTRGDLPVVFNACDLRTGNAFRYQKGRVGGSAVGASQVDQVLSHAVAASAAFPMLLPAFDEEFEFERKGEKAKRRVVLTDGGVFDNLGISCMEPGRDDRFSEHVFSPQYIICCNAGHGQFDNSHIPYGFYSRIDRSVEVIFKKVQDAAMKRLHHYVASGQVRGFILPYLGQIDRLLPFSMPGLIPRDAVCGYPTDFAAMSDEDIERISKRGEQLTSLLLSYYCPEL